MNIRDLKYFLAVAELSHFGRAAEMCFVSQPTLSGQIKKLEDELGVKLFERTNKRVMLTGVGEKVVQSAKTILREVDLIHDIATNNSDPLSGDLKIGAFPTISTYLFPKLVNAINDQLPKVRLILIEEKTADLVSQLKEGLIDMAILALPVDDDSFHAEKLFDDEFLLAVPEQHELAKYNYVEQQLLSTHRLLLLNEGHCLRDQALAVCKINGIAEDYDLAATGLETLRLMVKSGTGITFMPKIAINADDEGISYIPFKTPAPYRTIGLVWRKTTARQQLIDEVLKLLKTAYATA